ncbi:DUF3060 domain-containing protein [Marinitenerispora sediminis]|uniref:DUF3060 domain-containing protein n=1 Tax=Marinitenerispora sediminis TaxID=1931232 RepID=A0A368T9T8_9ACTN|nr:DUF3060 domain-containing protein [Marinitenerispora sediminis]RCV54604.1 hypothetical protein DEF28_07895 [Marinitenerispora sediminis]RCV59841.1 hypothetical protein DEF23_06170 [Marinitenerispora sediminis]RCV61168.1 hypothetical protein DEF24_04880 [Marinitenerispora sediminis]
MRHRIAALAGGLAIVGVFGTGCGVSVSEDGVSVTGEDGGVSVDDSGVSVSDGEGGDVSIGDEGGVSLSDEETLRIAGGESERTEDCAGRDVTVLASDAVIVLNGACGAINVAGSDNQIDVGTAESFTVAGSGNTIRYASGDPRSLQVGEGNSIGQGGDATE